MSRKNIPKGVLLPFHSGFIGWFPASYSVTEFGLKVLASAKFGIFGRNMKKVY